jgi:predicted RNA-binding protein with PUA-like domain
MNYWLVKSEPDVYHFDTLLKDKKVVWDGVRNFAARLHLKAMKKGDLVLFYHSTGEKAVVGTAKVSKEWYPEPGEPDWAVVEITPEKKLKNTVTLAAVKADTRLREMKLVTLARLSVQPVTEGEFGIVLEKSEKK